MFFENVGTVLLDIQEGATPEEAARDWIDYKQDKVTRLGLPFPFSRLNIFSNSFCMFLSTYIYVYITP